ncbi:UDP-N-acetylglucosamine 1-carboxyvinyltransferase [Desulfofalx alkaliphila]|uniref:UDP-N-acetylglucosamine 1-carboxyvinyltransferase n=1 Tax=Desulfofalx alkaliphila TaxID=105483 RepID=UPI0004E15B58|nr:UDP-N-acetylglucosamine 1-carboxyvinyltransferase [Desulfofalx alkaliphila]
MSSQKFLIVGKSRLKGTVKINGSKNATLPILAATLLCSETATVKDLPNLHDVNTMKDVLTYLGARVNREGRKMIVDSSEVQSLEISEDLMRRMRASNLVLGPLLARFGYVKISYPGGCNIGSRPMNLHLKGLQAMGAVITEKFGYITAETPFGLQGTEIHLDMPSVGATENLMMAAALADGITTIRNAAKEPEIVDLQSFLVSMGAKISGAGTDTIRIEGVQALKGTEHTVIPDRIEAGTYMVAAAITNGDITLTNVIPVHLDAVIAKLREAGVQVTVNEDTIRVQGVERPKAVDIKTMPYPGFPTDMQPQFLALMSIAEGTSIISETIFENRFKHVAELRRMGADIRLEGNTAIVRGVPGLTGAYVEASDLRAGAALTLAAMAAEDGTVLDGIEHIDRGYERMEKKYNPLGARIIRVNS